MVNLAFPRWEDIDGVVHIVGTHSVRGVWAACGALITGHFNGVGMSQYKATHKHATCMQCISPDGEVTSRLTARAIRDFNYRK